MDTVDTVNTVNTVDTVNTINNNMNESSIAATSINSSSVVVNIENKIISRTPMIPTNEENLNDSVLIFINDEWYNGIKENTSLYKECMTDEDFKKYVQWFEFLEDKFNITHGCVLNCYKWACAYRYCCHLSSEFSPIKSVRFVHENIVHDKLKFHTNEVLFEYVDGIIVNVPINETINYSLMH